MQRKLHDPTLVCIAAIAKTKAKVNQHAWVGSTEAVGAGRAGNAKGLARPDHNTSGLGTKSLNAAEKRALALATGAGEAFAVAEGDLQALNFRK